jgi:hypothetical protein
MKKMDADENVRTPFMAALNMAECLTCIVALKFGF